MTIKQALIKGVTVLKLEKISTPKLKARLLLQFVLKKPRQYLIVYDNQKLTDKEEQEYLKYIELLTQGEPIEHITHQKEFMKLNFYVDENVLIPRQDTEVLVEAAIAEAEKSSARTILDLGTGSGCIILSIMGDVPALKGWAVDASSQAMEVARINAGRLGLDSRMTFVNASWFDENLPELLGTKFDIVVSNPPYIPSAEIAELESQLASAKEAAYAAIQPTVDEVLEKISAGEDFDALIEQYGQDPGMQSSPAKEDGYPVSADSTNWVTEFRDAAMALENVGDVSEPVRSEYGIHIIKYVSDAAEGEVGLDAVREALESELLTQKQDEAYNAAVEAWVEEADAKIYKDRMN